MFLFICLQFNQVTVEDATSPMKCLKTTKLVLEADENSQDAVIEVHKNLICKLKPHQVEGLTDC
jgi:transcriptional regulator ATRX